jgi:tungstate transport system substrate-binding protein
LGKAVGTTLLLAVLVGALAGCELPWAKANKEVIMATTTSTRDSGLLDVLIPAFEAKSDYIIKSVAVGTGQALEMGIKGEADVLLVHAPSSERPLVEDGTAISRRLVMHNDFVLVGPPADPAGIADAEGAVAALAAIAAEGEIFISRGDESGTHKMEKALWTAAELTPSGNRWYQEAGLGMGETLAIASEKQGYTLTDRATYLARKATLDLAILSEGDPVLLNLYHVMEVSSKKFPKVNAKGAKAWADWLLSAEAQAIVAAFGVDKYGEPLFFADGGKTEAEYAPH